MVHTDRWASADASLRAVPLVAVVGLALVLVGLPATADAQEASMPSLLKECLPQPVDELTKTRIARLDPSRPTHALALGVVHLRSRPEQSLTQLRGARAAFLSEGNFDEAGHAWTFEAAALHRLGRLDEAKSALDQAQLLADRVTDSLLQAEIDVERSSLLFNQGESLATARRLLLRSRTTAMSRCRLKRDWLWHSGNIAYELGRQAESRQARRELVDLSRDSADLPMLATALYNLAITYWSDAPRPADRDRLVSLLEQALEVANRSDQSSVRSRSTLLLGKLLSGEQGDGHLATCQTTARNSESPCRLAECLRAMSRRAAAENPQRATHLWRETQSALARCSDPWAPVFAWPAHLEVAWQTLGRQEAIDDFERTLERIEELRDNQHATSGRANVFSNWADAYQRFAGYLLNDPAPTRSAIEKSFQVTERMRSRVLLEGIQQRNRGQVSEEPLNNTFSSLAEVESSLAQDEALVAFSLGQWTGAYGEFAGGSWVTTSTTGGTRVARLPDRSRIHHAVQAFRGLVNRRDGSENHLDQTLYRLLLQESLESLPPDVDRLIVVADGPLHGLAIEALENPETRELVGSTFALSRAPSATIWRNLVEGRPERRPATTLVLADPDFTESPDHVGDGNDSPEMSKQLFRLPFAQAEARAIVSRLGALANVRIGPEASKEMLRRLDLRATAVLHFAAHAVIHADEPDNSSILLAAEQSDSSLALEDVDGRLLAREIRDLEFPAGLAVLSTCSSAGGSVLRGEGVMSLARAFFEAGAQTVVATLEPLRDDEASQLVARLYAHLAAGRTVAQALQNAQEDLRSNGVPTAAWAGVVVLGDGGLSFLPTPEPPASASRWLLAAVVGVAALWLLSRRLRSVPT